MAKFVRSHFVRLLIGGSAVAFGALMPASASATSNGNVYSQLVDAAHFIENYRESAAVSAQVFAARGQGSDADFAKFMASVARYGIADVKDCVAQAFSNPPMTPDDAADLIKIFKSPMGKKILDLGQATMINNIRHMSSQGVDASTVGKFTAEERRDLVEIRRRPSMVHYGQLMGSAVFRSSLGQCIQSSKAARESGLL